jgi:hypothetical protein
MVMRKPKKDKEREERITMEIVVDANGPEEQAMGWYYYLEERLHFPFTAICNGKRAISPLHINDEVDVIGMAPEEECERDVRYNAMGKRRFSSSTFTAYSHQ